jgi:hypothetical protein
MDFLQNTPQMELAEKVEKGMASKKQALEKYVSWQSFNISRERARKVFALP